MKTFSQLLSEYIHRIGVSDTELARRLGVSRQTVFRWREGRTKRPRHREDVLLLTSKLRLTPEERDALLIAGGFHPQAPVDGAGQEEEAPETEGPAEEAPKTFFLRIWDRIARSKWFLPLASAWTLLILILAATGLWREVAAGLGFTVEGNSSPAAWPDAAEPGETLVLISEFANYGGEQIGYNVAGRIRETMQQDFKEAGLEGVRIEALPEIITDEAAARRTGEAYRAALVVWGEYDSGRVIAVITAPLIETEIEGREQRWIIATSEELNSIINTDLPKDVRWISLYVLGNTHLAAGRYDEAEAVFKRTLVVAPQDPRKVARIYFFLGLLEASAHESDLDEVIAYYSEAVERYPELTSALNNRGIAYLNRGLVGDIERAETDFRLAIASNPSFEPPVINLAITLIRQDPDQLHEALSLLEQFEGEQAASADIHNALCWYLSLAGKPQDAMSHCDRAVEMNPSGYTNDSRGLALALLGRYEEAAQEFRFFLEKLQFEDIEAYQRFVSTRAAWIEMLEAGENPFDAAILQDLLQE